MKPIEKFSFQYNVEEYKLLEYVYPVAQDSFASSRYF